MEIDNIAKTAMTEFKEGTPWPFSAKVQEAINGTKEDYLFGLKVANRWLFAQFWWLAVQLIALFATLVIAAWGLGW